MPSLGFLSPLFLLGALTVAVPVVLHLFRRRADPVVPFSATRFLRRVPVQDARRRRLHDVLLLALRAAALLLLALGFARPYFESATAAAPAGVTVVAVDGSASVGDAPRAARLRALARQAIDATPRGQAVAVIRFASTADLLVAPTLDRAAARTAADGIVPGFAPTRYRSALARAAELLPGGAGRVVMITDLQAGGWAQGPEAALPRDAAFEVVDVGPQPPNAGIVALERSQGGLRAQLRSTGPARRVTVTLEIDGQPRGEQAVALPEDGVADAVFRVPLPASGAARARLAVAGDDGLPADDERWLVLDARVRPRIVVVLPPGPAQPEGLYIRRALESADAERAVDAVTRTADRLRAEDLDGAAVAIVIGTAGLHRDVADRLVSFVEAGGGLLLPVGPEVNLDLLAASFGDRLPHARVGPPLQHASGFVVADGRHPVFRAFGADDGAFDGTRFTRVAVLRAGQQSEVLARFDDGAPALVASVVGRGRLIVLASDLSNRWNDLVLQPAFVPLLIESTGWLAGGLGPPEALVAGDSDRNDTQRPGIAQWRAPGQNPSTKAVPVAVNVDPRELDQTRESAQEFAAHVMRSGASSAEQIAELARQREAEQRWWQYGLALMLASLVVESIVGRRG